MQRYVAFLRGINVAGHKLIKMEELARIFRSNGYKNVRTYIQSGNVIFDSAATNSTALAKKLERQLAQDLGYAVTVIVKKLSELEAMVTRNPFKKIANEPDVMMLYVVFLAGEPQTRPKLPLIFSSENLEVVAIKEQSAFVVARRKQDGRGGFPNAIVEKRFGVSATTRNWSTVKKIVLAAEETD